MVRYITEKVKGMKECIIMKYKRCTEDQIFSHIQKVKEWNS